jgi:hypothetical protein
VLARQALYHLCHTINPRYTLLNLNFVLTNEQLKGRIILKSIREFGIEENSRMKSCFKDTE